MKMILNSEVKVIEEVMFGDISHQFPSICYFQIRKLKKTSAEKGISQAGRLDQ